MTEQEREELIEKMANKMFASKQYNGCFTLTDMACAALDVAEPVIREQCAKKCEGDFDSEMKGYGTYFAAAIREGKEDE